jgi:two-component system sensor histidine kinase UhpB
MWEQYKKEFFRTDNAAELMLRHLAMVLLYGTAFLCFYFFSRNFFTHQGWSTWYMPAGLRLAVLLILPWRYWPTLIATEFFCQRSITIGYGNVLPEVWGAVLRYGTKQGLVMLAALWFKYRWPVIQLHKTKYVLVLIALMLWESVVSASALVWFTPFYQNIPTEQKLSMWWAFICGNQIGIFLLSVPLLGLWQLWLQRHQEWEVPAKRWQTASAFLLIFLAFFLFRTEPDALYLVLSLSLFPAAMLCYLTGWAGAVIALMTINFATAFTLYGQSGTLTMQQLQAFVLLLNIAILLFGALMSTQQSLTRDLRQQAAQQTELAIRNQQLSEKFSSVLEYERKVVSNELHDELGQVATGLKLQIKALQRQESNERLDKLSTTVDTLYDAIYRLMHQLTPRLLEERGLIASLTQGPLPEMLSHADINYSHQIDASVDALPEPLKVLLYRAAQEALTNVAKHANASWCRLSLEVKDGHCYLIVENDVVTRDVSDETPATAGFGLKNLQERVWAARGRLTSTLGNSTFTLNIEIPTALSSDSNLQP